MQRARGETRPCGALGGKAGVSRLGVLVHLCSAWVAGVQECRPGASTRAAFCAGDRDMKETRLALSRRGESAIFPGGSQADFIGKLVLQN